MKINSNISEGAPYNIQTHSTDRQPLMTPSNNRKGLRGQVSTLKKCFYSFWYGGTTRRNSMVLLGMVALLFVVSYRGSLLRPKFLFPSSGRKAQMEHPASRALRNEVKADDDDDDDDESKSLEYGDDKKKSDESEEATTPETSDDGKEKEEKKPEEVKKEEEEEKQSEEEKKEAEEKKLEDEKKITEEEKKMTEEEKQKAEEEKKEEEKKEAEEQKKEEEKKEAEEKKKEEKKEAEEKKPAVPQAPVAAVLTSDKALSFDGNQFKLDGKELQILSGAIHYFRVPPEYWKDRLRKLKACGLNTVETYIPWNLHERYPGNYSFSGPLDLEKFIALAKGEGLYVILRPGPYICAEWDLGGLPAWLLSDPEMRLRTTSQKFKDAVEKYFAVLGSKIIPHQHQNNGPVLMIQLENEYGQYARDEAYLPWIRDLWLKLGIKEKFFTSDPASTLSKGMVKDELMMVNGKDGIGDGLDKLKEMQPGKPLMVGELWTGWFDHWGQPSHSQLSEAKYVEILGAILQRSASFNLYMFHGGTNFGFLNGANFGDKLKPHVTSYDYDAPVSESGELKPKYFATCKVIAEKTKSGYEYKEETLNALKTALPPPKEYGRFEASEFLSIQSLLKAFTPTVINKLVPMEQLCSALVSPSDETAKTCKGQSFGYIAYTFYAKKGAQKLQIKVKFADRLQLIMNNKLIHTEEASESGELNKEFPLGTDAETLVILLVENMGRANYGGKIDTQRKGILDGTIAVDGAPVSSFSAYKLDFCSSMLTTLAAETTEWKPVAQLTKEDTAPVMYRISLKDAIPTNLKENEYPADTFLNFKDWVKGVVLINSFNLGRYWNIGPQKTLYVPGPRLVPTGLDSGKKPNLIIFELHPADAKPDKSVTLQATADLG